MNSPHHFRQVLLVALGLAGGAGTLSAATPTLDNPYTVITNRNAFGIRPPPEPEPVAPPAPPTVPPNIFLTGVSHQGTAKKAFFVINRPGSKAPEYESATEGDVLQDLKVLEINAREGRVKVNVAGREMILNFADNALKATPMPAVPNAPGKPGNVPQPVAPVPTAGAGGAGGGPVVIGRGGVNVRNANANPGGGAVGGPVGVAVPLDTGGPNSAATGTTVRTLPVRSAAQPAQVQPEYDHQQPVVEDNGRIPLPVPPPLPGGR